MTSNSTDSELNISPKDLDEQLKAIQRAIANLTNLISKSLEEKRYSAIRERERRWS